MKKVIAYTDGSSLGNPGPGGYGAILQFEKSSGEIITHELSQGYRETTNNRMEIMGVLAVLEALKERVEVTITTDSQYVVKAFTEGWIDSWKARGWRKADKKPVQNVDLWKRIDALRSHHVVNMCWTKGHAGHEFNERCDILAKEAALSPNLLIDEGYKQNS